MYARVLSKARTLRCAFDPPKCAFGPKVFRRHCSGSEFERTLVKEKFVQDYLESSQKSLQDAGILDIYKSRDEALETLRSIKDLEKDESENKEWKETLLEERKAFEEKLTLIDCELVNAFAPKLPDSNAIEFEITAGVGGQEAMLFAKVLFEMYQSYFDYKSWDASVAELSASDIGGIRHACFLVEGFSVLKFLQFESGVHRVQRVPATEKSGRVHTSTVTISVCPQPPEIDVQISPKDLHIETKRSTGAGGQHVNKTDSCVRMTHIPTGIVVECQTDRSQIKNRKFALQRLQSKIYQRELEEQDKSMRDSRKSQVGTSARSDKVRTYNYLQDRITDHRLHHSWHNLPQFFRGAQMLDEAVNKLVKFFREENLRNFVATLKTKR